jgi:hypothetical protein
MKILGHEVPIQKSVEKLVDAFGYLEKTELKIFISDQYNKSTKETTILHEIMEAVNFISYLELTETQIRGLEVGLYETLTTAGVKLSPLLKELEKPKPKPKKKPKKPKKPKK